MLMFSKGSITTPIGVCSDDCSYEIYSRTTQVRATKSCQPRFQLPEHPEKAEAKGAKPTARASEAPLGESSVAGDRRRRRAEPSNIFDGLTPSHA